MAKILFAQEMFFPLQSTQALSAFLKRGGHSTDVAIGSPSEIVEYAKETGPDLIAFSVLTAYRNHMLATTSLLKESIADIPVIAGGYDITFMPQILPNSDLDIICIGEGGDPIVELADALEAGKNFCDLDIHNLHIKLADGSIKENKMRNWSMYLDTAPFDDRDIYWNKDPYFHIIPFTQVLAGRGCPYPCTYCFNEGYKQIHVAAGMKASDYTNFRSVDHVIEELKMLSEKYNARYFFFNDSTLTYNKPWILEFCDKYKCSGLKQSFSLNAVIPELTEEVCQALADTGKCQLIRFGLETGNEEFRIKTLRKSIRNKKLIEGVDILNRHGLRYSMQMMLGLPGETYEYAWETIEMARKITGDTGVHGINIFKPFPGLEINNIGLELGEYQAVDVIAPGSVPPPTWRKESFEETISASEGIALPEDEAYLASRSSMNSSGGSTATMELKKEYSETEKDASKFISHFGTTEMVFYDNYRRDALGVKILKLSRYSHLAIRFPGLRSIIEKFIELPDNAFNRLVWKLTEGFLNIRVHANAPLSYVIKYALFHSDKKIR